MFCWWSVSTCFRVRKPAKLITTGTKRKQRSSSLTDSLYNQPTLPSYCSKCITFYIAIAFWILWLIEYFRVATCTYWHEKSGECVGNARYGRHASENWWRLLILVVPVHCRLVLTYEFCKKLLYNPLAKQWIDREYLRQRQWALE